MNHNDDIQSHAGFFSSVRWKRLAALPVVAFLILMVIIISRESPASYESPFLLAFLNTVFLCVIPLVVAYLAARSHAATGILAFLLAGCGLVFFGASSLYAGWVMPLAGGPNPTVTLHNLGSLFAGVCEAAAAHFFLKELAGISETTPRVQKYWMFYAGITVLVSITAVLAFQNNLPVFFDPLTGASPLRQIVLGGAICFFAVAGLVFMELYAIIKTEFAYGFGLALWLITIGLTCVLLQPSVGSLLGWTGRAAQYVGSVYFVFAILQGRRELHAAESPATTKTGWALWPYLEQKVAQRTAALTSANAALQIEITERKQAEEALRESDSRSRAILETAMDGFWLADMQGHILQVNEAYCRMSGYSRQELLAMSIPDLEVNETANETTGHLQKVLTQGQDRFESKHRHKDGHSFDVEISVQYRPAEGGQMVAFLRDITQRQEAEDALRESEDRFRQLFQSMDSGFALHEIICDAQGIPCDYRFLEINPAFERQTGLKAALFIGHTVMEMLPGTEKEWIERYGKVALTGESVNFESYHQDLNKTYQVIAYSPRRGHFAVIFQDITERVQVEEALRENEQKYKALYESAGVGIGYYTPDGTVISYNTLAADHMGGKPEDFTGKSIYELFPKTAADVYMERIRKAAATNGTQEYEDKVDLPGQPKWFVSAFTRILDASNQVMGIQIISTDITKAKETEQALRHAEASLAEAQRISHVGSWEWDLVANTVRWSDEMYRVFDINPEDYDGKPETLLKMIHPDDVESFTNSMNLNLSGGNAPSLEYRVVYKDGSIHNIFADSRLEIDESGRPVRRIGTVQDITERKQVEHEKQHLYEQLLQAQKMESVGRLAGGVAHDFNNLLGVINGRAETALAKVSPLHPLYHDLGEILKAGQRSADLTRQLLAFARKQPVNPVVLDLNSAVASIFEMLRRLIGEDIELVWLPDPALWYVLADSSQIDQILTNLLVNARDAIPGMGQVIIETHNIVCDDALCAQNPGLLPGEYVLLAVRDTGSGMDGETLVHLFEPFYTTKATGKGTGLGLSTVFGIVKQNNGYITVSSEPGQGSTFSIYLPRVQAELAPQHTATPLKTPQEAGEMILMVEDEEALLELAKETLEEIGYTVLGAITPAAALRLAREHPAQIRLLITDVIMPGMNGKVLAEQLRAILPGLKCLFMSGYTADIISERGVLAGGISFIQKPFPLADLAAKVREVLEQK